MVVCNNTLPLPFPDSSVKPENSVSSLNGDFAYSAPENARSFSHQLDSAFQARQPAPALKPRPAETDAAAPTADSAAQNADKAESAASSAAAKADERKAKSQTKSQDAAPAPADNGAPSPEAQAVAIAPVLTANVAPSSHSDVASAAHTAAQNSVPNVVAPTQNAQNLAAPVLSAAQTVIAAVPEKTAASIASPGLLKTDAATPAPQNQTATARQLAAPAAPTPSGNSVDSRLAVSAATPGTETAHPPVSAAAIQTPAPQSGTPQAAALQTNGTQNPAPINAAPNMAVIDAPVKETLNAQVSSVIAADTNAVTPATVPITAAPAAINATSAPNATTAAPTPTLAARPTAAATSDQLARLRTVGNASSPAPVAAVPAETPVPNVNLSERPSAAPTPSGNSVDSRLAVSAATPGTETAHPAVSAAAIQTPAPQSGTPQAAALQTNGTQNPAPINAAPNVAVIAAPVQETLITQIPPGLAANANPDTNAVIFAPVQTVARPADNATTTPPAAPTPQITTARPTAAATSDQLARLRTVGNASSPAPVAEVPTEILLASNAAANANPTDRSPAAPQNAPAAASSSPTATAQNALPAPAAPKPNNVAALTSPFDSTASASVSAFSAATQNSGLPTLQNAPFTANSTKTSVNQAVVTAGISGASADVRQAKAGSSGDKSQDEDRSTSDRTIGAAAAIKSNGAAEPSASANGAVAAGTVRQTVPAPAAETTLAPADRTKLLSQVNQHLETMRFAEGRGEATFLLNPDSLGSLRISVSAHADGVTARIVAEHAGVRQALEAASEPLRAALENRGLKLHTLDVTTAQGSFADGRGASNHQQAAQQQREAWQDRAAFGSGSASGQRRPASPANEAATVTPLAASAVSNKTDARLDYRA